MNPSRFIRENIKSIIGYILFSLTAFILFLYLLFPREAIKARVLYEIEKGMATEVKATGDRWGFPIGLTFKGLQFIRKSGDTSQILAQIDRLSIRIPVRSILSLSPVSELTADLYGGSAVGLLTLRGNNRMVQANWKNVDISRIERLKDIPAELSGKVSGDMVVKFNSSTPEGQIRFLIKEGILKKIKILGFPLPDIPVDELIGVMDIKGQTLSLKDAHFKNSDIKGTIKGDIQLHLDAGSGDLNISIRFSVGEKMKKDYQGLLSLMERSKDREGYYTIQIKGDLKKPSVNM